MKRKRTRRVLSWLMTLAFAMSLVPVYTLQALAAQNNTTPATGESIYNDIIQDVEDGKDVPLDYSSSACDDPYGYGTDVPFYLAGQKELAVFRSYGGGSGERTEFKSYDGLTEEGWNTKELLADKTANMTYSVPEGNSFPLNYVKMTAFDPTGSGRDDHIAMIGVHYTSDTDKGLYLIVFDAKGHNSGYQEIGKVTWMGHELYNAMNCLSITAGDYNHDKKDTLVIYGAFDNKGMGLYEYDVTSGGSSVTVSKKNASASAALLNPDADLTVTNGQPGRTLNASVDTGDVNGDKIDDLVVSSYKDEIDSNNKDGCYPYVAVSLGSNGVGIIASKKDLGAKAWRVSNNGSLEGTYLTGMSVGDINGDRRDEIVLGGVSLDRENDKMAFTTLAVSGNTLEINSFNKVAANMYTADGTLSYIDEESSSPQTSVQCVAFDGPGNPEQIFMNGFIYKYRNAEVVLESENNTNANNQYFHERDNYLGASTSQGKLSNTFFWSVTAGNFTGENSSREQLVFVTCLKTEKAENYHFVLGMIQGQHREDSQTNVTGLTNYYQYTDYNVWDGAIVPAYMVDADAQLNRNKALNFAICPVDNDDDGVIVRYKGKGYAYSDPQVLAVLQSTPYFDEVPYDSKGGSTTYTISESRSVESGISTSKSAGFAIVASVETDICDTEIESGYSAEWSEGFNKGVSTSRSYYWTANGTDQVVVYRTPVILYNYEVMKADGTWDPEEAMVINVPCSSAYTLMSIDQYNDFANVFNQKVRAKVAGQSIPNDKIPQLGRLYDPYLHHEGDPSQYRRAVNTPPSMILQDSAQEFTVGDSTTGFDFSQSTSHSHSSSTTHSFSFDMTISCGFEIFGNGAKVGGKTSLGYSQENSTTQTTEQGSGCNCSIANMDAATLSDAGIDPDFVRNYYGLNYQMAMWDSNLDSDATTGSGKVPIVGYALSNVRRPSSPKLYGPKSLTLDEGYAARTITGYSLSADPVPTVTKVKGNDKITFDSASKTIQIAAGLKQGKYPVSFKVSNGNPNVDMTFSFMLTVVGEGDSAIFDLCDEIRGLSTNENDYFFDDRTISAVRTAKRKYDALSDEDKAKLSPADLQKLNTVLGIADLVEETQTLLNDGSLEPLKKIISNDSNEWKDGFMACTDLLKDDSGNNYYNDPQGCEEAWSALNTQYIPDIEAGWEVYCSLSYPQLYLINRVGECNSVEFNTFFDRIGLAQLKYAEFKEEPIEQDWEARDQIASRYDEFWDNANDFNPANDADAASTYDTLCEVGAGLRNDYYQLEGWIRASVAFSFFRAEETMGEKYYKLTFQAAKDADAATAVEKTLRLLPEPDYLDVSDEELVNEAAQAYDALSASQKALVRQDLVENLAAVREEMAELLGDPKPIEDASVSLSSQTYTGSPLTPVPVVTYEGKPKPLKEGVDYRLKYENNTEVGYATVLITGMGKYTGRKTVFFAINPINLQGTALTLSATAFTYNGKVQKPTIKKINGLTLTQGTDYTVDWSNASSKNAGTYTVTVTGTGNYTGTSARATYKINRKALVADGVTLSSTSYTYTGTAKKPGVTVKDGSKELTANTDYTAVYDDGRVNVGTYHVTVTGKGNYSGTLSKSFKINSKAITADDVTLSATSYTYSGAAKKPGVTVKDGTKTLVKDTDYTVAYKNNTNVGTATVIVTGKGNYSGTASKSFTIKSKALAAANVTLSAASYTYNGSAKKPGVTVTNGTKTLVKDTDYTVAYKNNTNAGTATVTVTGKGNYSGTVNKTFTIKAKAITPAVTLSKTAFVYNGKVQKPTITVKDGTTTLTTANYTVTWPTGCKVVGIYKPAVKLKGNYSGSKTVSYKINPKGTTLSKVTAVSKGFTAAWTKQATQTTGYQIQYSPSSTFASGNKSALITKNTTLSKKVTGLTAKKKYYVRVRTYKTVGTTKYYSAWSSSLAVTTKA